MPISPSKVKMIMAKKGITPEDLGEKMNLSKSRISTLINCKSSAPQIRTIHSLATALEVDVNEIVE
ncbi:MAG: helix-turn-helix transcriptional regulator [Clostridium butyricum]|nr:helix-turn-helix transcriptional regulator [Clostridium butyricum]